MKFVKVIIDGKEYYEKVEKVVKNENTEEKASEEKKIPEPEIIDADIEDGEEPGWTEKFNREAYDFFEKVGAGAKDLGEKIVSGAKDLGGKIKNGTERLFNKDKSEDPNSTEAKLLRLLPYMSKEDAHGVAVKLIENDKSLKNLDISTIMTFLTPEDCDAVFLRCIELDNRDYDIAKAIPHVSKAALSTMVDNYIAGKYPELDIDELYPFLSDSDIKRIFYHIIENDKKES